MSNSHAILLVGSPEKTLQAAQAKAAEILGGGKDCENKVFQRLHPDVIYIQRAEDDKGKLKSEIVVSQIRTLSADAIILPNNSSKKIYIFPEAELMNENAQNAFLKLLEEPPSFVTFLLCVKNSNAMLPTIRSRCIQNYIGGESGFTRNAQIHAEDFLQNRNNPTELFRSVSSLEKQDSSSLLEIIQCIQSQAPKEISSLPELLHMEDFLSKACQYLQAKVSPKNVLGYLSTYIPKDS